MNIYVQNNCTVKYLKSYVTQFNAVYLAFEQHNS